jgi:tetratricopeptide (TPR) repeat protein
MGSRLLAPLAALALGACSVRGASPSPAAVPPPPATPPPRAAVPDTTSPQDVERARALLEQGLRLYGEGQYDQAEASLQQAITLYPFLAEANLTLAKILLIRASATHDPALYANARQMLEMARALDPGSHETAELLDLVQRPTAP